MTFMIGYVDYYNGYDINLMGIANFYLVVSNAHFIRWNSYIEVSNLWLDRTFTLG